MADDTYREDAGEASERGVGSREARTRADGGIASLNEALRTLSHPTRRAVLYHLREHQVATLDELTVAMAARETGSAAEDLAEEDHEQITAALAHNHLPKLSESLFIEYDTRSQTARYADPPALLNLLVVLLAQFEDVPED